MSDPDGSDERGPETVRCLVSPGSGFADLADFADVELTDPAP